MFTVIIRFGLLLSSSPQTPLERIVSASNVRPRSAPQTASEELTRVSLGTVITELEASPDRMWFRVQLPDGKTGWIFSSLTQPYSERDATAIYRRIIARSRYSRLPMGALP
jgi:hypothetical protein